MLAHFSAPYSPLSTWGPAMTSRAQRVRCPLLPGLDLSHCGRLVGASLAGLGCPVLTDPDLSYCGMLTNAALAGLECPLLTGLYFDHCPGISIPKDIGNTQEQLFFARSGL